MLNIKKIFEKIADAGQKILENKNLKKPAKKDLIDLCDELLSSKGAAFGITLARDILFRYNNISFEEKEKFLKKINEKYKPNVSEIENSISNFNRSKDDLSILNLSELYSAQVLAITACAFNASRGELGPISYGSTPFRYSSNFIF